MTKTDKQIRNLILRRAIIRLKFHKLFFPNLPYGMCSAMRKQNWEQQDFLKLFPDFTVKNYLFFHGKTRSKLLESSHSYNLYWDSNDKEGLKRRITFLKAIKKNG